MEAKKDEFEDPSELQKFNITRIKKAGGIALVIYPENWEQTKQLLTKMNNGEI